MHPVVAALIGSDFGHNLIGQKFDQTAIEFWSNYDRNLVKFQPPTITVLTAANRLNFDRDSIGIKVWSDHDQNSTISRQCRAAGQARKRQCLAWARCRARITRKREWRITFPCIPWAITHMPFITHRDWTRSTVRYRPIGIISARTPVPEHSARCPSTIIRRNDSIVRWK